MKCITCGAELPQQSRFCGACGTIQPGETNADANSLETVRSKPHADNSPANVPPPPPRPPQNTGEIQQSGEISPSAQEENKPQTNSSTGPFNNPPSGPHPQTFYDDRQQSQQSQQLQQPHSSYQQQPYVDYQSPPSPYGNYQQTPQAYGNYQQPSQPYGNYQTPPQAYGNYQQSPLAQPPYINFPPTQHFGEHQTPAQPSGISQQLPQPLPSGIHTTNPIANVNADTTGGMKPVTPETRPKVPAWRKWAIIGVVAIFILAGSGILMYFLLKPTPTILVTSDYHYNGIPAGATGTKFLVKGQKFAANSPITFQLDTTLIRESMQEQSDASGSVSADLTVTSDWSVGSHTLTAHDASNNTTNTGVTINIVQQGYNGTPGPNGAPTNTAIFKIMTTFHDATSNLNILKHIAELDVKGLSDSQGGSLCSPSDNGQKDNFPSSTGPNGTTLTETMTYLCTSSSSYKDGRVTYDETLLTDEVADSGGLCQLTNAHPHYVQMSGIYKNPQDQFSGDATLNLPGSNDYTCRGDLTFKPFNSNVVTGSWTGTVQNS